MYNVVTTKPVIEDDQKANIDSATKTFKQKEHTINVGAHCNAPLQVNNKSD